MKTQHSNSSSREALGFAECVQQYIAPFLATRNFICTEQTLYSVEFRSADVALTVFHNPFSYEIDVVYARHAAPSEQYGLHRMLDVALGPDHKQEDFFQASERHRVVACIKAIAELLRRYGEGVLTGDPGTYQRIGDAVRQSAAAYTKQVVQGPIRKAAETAWQKRDYAKVKDLYEPIEGDLTPAEKRRLDYARSHSRTL